MLASEDRSTNGAAPGEPAVRQEPSRRKSRRALSKAEQETLAHDLKNPLSGIRAAIDIVRSNLPEDDANRRIIVKVIESIDSLLALVDQRLRPPR